MVSLDFVFKAIVLNKILYVLPIYFVYLTEGQRHMLQRVLQSRGFTLYYYYLDTLAESAHYHLFLHSCRQAHCLNHLYIVKSRPPGAMRLRTRGYQFELPAIKYVFNNRNLIVHRFLIMYNFVCFHLYYLHFCISLYTCANIILLNSYLLTYLLT